jgi:hypothetical protein
MPSILKSSELKNTMNILDISRASLNVGNYDAREWWFVLLFFGAIVGLYFYAGIRSGFSRRHPDAYFNASIPLAASFLFLLMSAIGFTEGASFRETSAKTLGGILEHKWDMAPASSDTVKVFSSPPRVALFGRNIAMPPGVSVTLTVEEARILGHLLKKHSPRTLARCETHFSVNGLALASAAR